MRRVHYRNTELGKGIVMVKRDGEDDEYRNNSRPTPDPTVLTTEALTRGLNAERDFTVGQVDIIQERLRGIDVATRLLNETVNRVPTDVTKEVTHLFSLMDERFRSVSVQFLERDTRSERESKDNKVAVDAAFAAQKEAAAKQDEANSKAIDKSEKTTAETIKTNADLARAENKALTDKYDDLKDRVARIESGKLGGNEAVSAAQQNSAANRAIMAIVISVLVLLAAIISVYAALKK